MKVILTTAAALIAVAATLACTGCGGGDDGGLAPTGQAVVRHTGADGRQAWLLIYEDGAELLDYMEAAENFRHAYRIKPLGALLATDESSASMARLIAVDALGTDRLHVEVVR